MTERSGLADWLKAEHELRPADDEAAGAIARLLGLRLQTSVTESAPSRRSPKAGPRDPEVDAGSAPALEPVPETKPRRRLDSVLVRNDASHNPAPAWLAAARHLETADASRIRPAIPLEPLFPTRTSRGILSGALATPAANGPLHLQKVVQLISQAEMIWDVPRVVIPTLARGVQLLIDRAEAMQPFAADQSLLRAALVSVAGRDRTDVFYFDGSPLWGAGKGTKEDWPEYQPPASGTPVVVLTDLGIGQPPGFAGLAGASDWHDFAVMLARKRCPLLALVPYSPGRWPVDIAKYMTVLQWDRPTTASVIRRVIPCGLRVAKEL